MLEGIMFLGIKNRMLLEVREGTSDCPSGLGGNGRDLAGYGGWSPVVSLWKCIIAQIVIRKRAIKDISGWGTFFGGILYRGSLFYYLFLFLSFKVHYLW